MKECDRLEKLQLTADTLMDKVAAWVQTLDPESAGTQTVRHLCATLKDLKELCQDLEGSREQSITVTIEGGQREWSD